MTTPTPNPNPNPPKIYITQRDPGKRKQPTGFVERVIRFCMLDTFGMESVTPGMRSSLLLAAFLLCLTFFYDYLAWTVMFAVALSGGQSNFGPWVARALLISWVIPFVVVVVERGFVVLDLSEHAVRSRWVAVAYVVIRLAVIGAVAFATAIPIEFVLLQGPIQTRMQQERLRRDVLEIQRLMEKSERDDNVRLTEAREANTGAQNTLVEAEVALRAATRNLTEKQNTLEAARKARPGLQRDLSKANAARQALPDSDPRVPAADQAVKGAEGAVSSNNRLLERLPPEISALKDAQDEATVRVKTAGENATGTKNILGTTQADARAMQKSLADCVVPILQTNPAESLKCPGSPFVSKPLEYDFVQKLTVLTQLATGEPPSWPVGASKETVAKAVAATSIDKSYLNDQDPAWSRGTKVMQNLLIALLFGSMLVPVMALTYKIVTPDLTQYYDVEYMASLGNAEAARQLSARNQMRSPVDEPSGPRFQPGASQPIPGWEKNREPWWRRWRRP